MARDIGKNYSEVLTLMIKLQICLYIYIFSFLKRGWAWLAHERIAYECFAYLWGTAVLWEDASGIKMCNQG